MEQQIPPQPIQQPSQYNPTQNKEAPVGVKIISILSYVGVGIFLIMPILMMFLFTSFGGSTFGAIAGVVNFIVFIPLAVLSFFIARGLWRGQKWSRIIMIVFSIISVVLGIWGLVMGSFNWSSIVSLVISGFIGGYLLFSKKAKEFFG